jgi:hypothetical protein
VIDTLIAAVRNGELPFKCDAEREPYLEAFRRASLS